MTATAFPKRRELARRTSDGIEVTLFWSKPSNRVAIAVLDTRSDEALEFEVEGRAALDAFNHPFAYAATQPLATSPRCASRRAGLWSERTGNRLRQLPNFDDTEGTTVFTQLSTACCSKPTSRNCTEPNRPTTAVATSVARRRRGCPPSSSGQSIGSSPAAAW
jgi:hypothetical protein